MEAKDGRHGRENHVPLALERFWETVSTQCSVVLVQSELEVLYIQFL